ncbi:hypothetical protein [Azospirillum canadense]|uniref:hypothetical protein n=1 Tax=Azospirillum canadense TaxID=403962 RepID=UPI002226F5AB|nr:hypothetical protein [Azospirillum canadense]MCW2240665.1 hypothetical protein [Azospirillum canadense]
MIPASGTIANLADLSRTGLLRPTQANSVVDAVRIALNTTAAPDDLPFETLREVPPAALLRATRIGAGSLKILNTIAANNGWSIGDRTTA